MPFCHIRTSRGPVRHLGSLILYTIGLALASAVPTECAVQSSTPQIVIVRPAIDAVLQPGRTMMVPIEIRHAGQDPASGEGLQVRYRWRALSGGRTDPAVRTPVPRTIAPGESLLVCVWVRTPAQPGTVSIEWAVEQVSQDLRGVVAWTDEGPPSVVATAGLYPYLSAEGAWPFARLAAFFAFTLGHFVLMVVWIRRLGGDRWDIETQAFRSALLGFGALQAVLHVLVFTIGLTLGRGLIGLAALHACAAVLVRRRAPRASGSAIAAVPPMLTPIAMVSATGLVVLAALVTQWIVMAMRSLEVLGTDALHYHVPYAINMALGANQFGAPATAHLYPMGTSVLAAWFIVPLQDPLLIDLAPLPAFLLLWFGMLYLFKTATGASGLAWGVPVALIAFSMPIVRESLFMGSDLVYAAAFVALNAVLLGAVARMRLDWWGGVALAMALGLLIGAKTLGTFSAICLVGVYGTLASVRYAVDRRGVVWTGWTLRRLLMGAALVVLSGGVWLVRNWWLFGSPIAPNGFSLYGIDIFPGRTNWIGVYTVVDDMRHIPGYNVWERVTYWITVWCGPWFLAAGMSIVALLVDLATDLGRRGRLGEETRARTLFVCATAAVLVAHGIVLMRAPWSSLEHYVGFSLRYALPCLLLYLLAGYACAFTSVLKWWRRWPRALPGVALCAAVAWYLTHQDLPSTAIALTPARLTPLCLMSVVVAGTVLLAIGRQRVIRPAPATAAVVAALAIAAAIGAGLSDRTLVRAAENSLAEQAVCHAPRSLPPNWDVFRDVYFDMLADEQATGRWCAPRRIYTTIEWNLPMLLQSPIYQSQVFFARNNTLSSLVARLQQPGLRPCDYIIVDRGELATDRGVPLLNAVKGTPGLRKIGERGGWATFGRDR